ncbi:MAG: amidase [Niveispirillum sp.]|uniref:amidase n=1 Tax=Niveispirillum sp. TaxID=1917217 RepID=UPI003BA4A851
MTNATSSVAWRDGLHLAAMIKTKEISAEEALEDAILRIGKVNPTLNAVAETLYDKARTALKTNGPSEGPFAGVPTFIKDLFMPVLGAKMRAGSLACAQGVAPLDAELITRLRRAGVTILGTTTSPEFGTCYSTESKLTGATCNPWSPTHIAGGSSGGAAALVAARALPLAHGNDGGGSLRVPASCCGVFGMKPTRGRVPIGPLIGEGWAGMGINHAITLSVRDSAALLDATAGMDQGAPYAAPVQNETFLSALDRPPARLRIGLVIDIAPWTTHVDCRTAVLDAARLCADLGHEITQTSLPVDALEFYDTVFTIIGAQTRSFISMLGQMTGHAVNESDLEARTRIILRDKGGVSGAAYAAAVDWVHAFGRRMAALFNNFDVLLMPTLAKPPLLLGSLDLDDDHTLGDLIERSHSFCPFTALFNASGQPAMSVPLHWTSNELPVGVHFAAPFGGESLLFALAGQLEKACPWIDQVPPVNALS